ncbi:MAG: energy transducer TonB [Telmatospirillum sp.]|nr:energy transducer TonB [Telmatospirillum sp.]
MLELAPMETPEPPAATPPAPRPAPPRAAAPRAAPVSEPVAAVPPPAAMSASTPDAGPPSWQGALRAHLERYKRYPSVARFRHQQGVSFVRFAMTRDGQVRWARLERGSGTGILDEEALDLVTRAQPLPAPPPEVTGGEIEIVVPIQFFLR